MSAENVRAHLHEAVQTTVGLDEDIPEGAMLLGWCCIAEWMAPDGNSWLSIIDGGANGDSLPRWRTQGYMHNMLFEPPISTQIEDDG